MVDPDFTLFSEAHKFALVNTTCSQYITSNFIEKLGSLVHNIIVFPRIVPALEVVPALVNWL